jgi:hypothetical protein
MTRATTPKGSIFIASPRKQFLFYARAASITHTNLVDMIVFPSNSRLMFFSVFVRHRKKKGLILV